MPDPKPLYIEEPIKWLSWLLLRISEAGNHREAMPQFYASMIVAGGLDIGDFVDEMSALWKRTHHLINNEDEIWIPLLPGGGQGMDEHISWSEALEAVKRYSAKDIQDIEADSYELEFYGPDAEGGYTSVGSAKLVSESPLNFAQTLLDQKFHMPWIMNEFSADWVIITEMFGERRTYKMDRDDAIALVGAETLSERGYIDPDVIAQGIYEHMMSDGELFKQARG